MELFGFLNSQDFTGDLYIAQKACPRHTLPKKDAKVKFEVQRNSKGRLEIINLQFVSSLPYTDSDRPILARVLQMRDSSSVGKYQTGPATSWLTRLSGRVLQCVGLPERFENSGVAFAFASQLKAKKH